jgi:hypothetical protein
VLRKCLLSNPDLRKNLCRCKHCNIFFICSDSNIGRTDLGCPFGCAEESRKRNAQKRSSDYYKTDEGKGKKKALNKKRASGNIEEKEFGNQRYKKIFFYLHFMFLKLDKIYRPVRDIEIIYGYFLKIVRQHPLFFSGKILHIPDE